MPSSKTILNKIVTSGSDEASIALSKLTTKKVNVVSSRIKEHDLEKVPSVFGAPDSIITVVYLDAIGRKEETDFPIGSLLLIFSNDDALRLADVLEDRALGTSNELNEMDKSALKETGNILAGACLAGMRKFLDFRLVESLPRIAIGTVHAALDHVIAKFALKAQKATIFETIFEMGDQRIKSNFVLIFDPGTHAILLKDIKATKAD